MTKSDVEKKFPAGQVRKELRNHTALVWGGRIVGIALAVAVTWHAQTMVSLYQRMIDYVVLAFILWRIYHLDTTLVFICGKGIVISRQPMNLREQLDCLYNEDDYYVFIPYEQIMGFTEGWHELQALNHNGGIYMVKVDIQFVSYKDKMELLSEINKHHKAE